MEFITTKRKAELAKQLEYQIHRASIYLKHTQIYNLYYEKKRYFMTYDFWLATRTENELLEQLEECKRLNKLSNQF